MSEAPQGFNIIGIQYEKIRCLSDSPWVDFHRQLDAHWYGKKRSKVPLDAHFVYIDTMGYKVIKNEQDFGILDETKFNILHNLYWQHRTIAFNAVNQNYPIEERILDSKWNKEYEINGVITNDLSEARKIIARHKMEGIEILLLLNLEEG